jgi:hypothetical protein
MVTVEDVNTIRISIEAFRWYPEIVESDYKVTGQLVGDINTVMQLNWPLTSMPLMIEVFNEETERWVKFRQRVSDQHRYYSLNPDYLIEIDFN